MTDRPKNYSWIENLLEDTEGNFGERITSFVLSRYLINVKQTAIHEAVSIIEQWLSYSNRRKLSQHEIRYKCIRAKKTGLFPVSLETIKQNDSETYDHICNIPNVLSHNKKVESLIPVKVENYDEKNNRFTKTTVFDFEQIGYSKTKDLYHFVLLCYDCNNRGAGGFEPHEKSFKFHEQRCKNIRYLTRSEEIKERFEVCYVRPLTDAERRILRDVSK